MEVYLGNASGNNVQCIRVTVMPLAEENKTKQMTPGCFFLLCFFAQDMMAKNTVYVH